jgi:hypothetical protein
MDDQHPPICATCGVTMVPASLSAREERAGDWISTSRTLDWASELLARALRL